jgi:hypothetical protein
VLLSPRFVLRAFWGSFLPSGFGLGVRAGVRLILICALAFSGFAFAQIFVSGSLAAPQTTTTIPKPDPPPTTVPKPEPPPTTSAQRAAPPPPQPQPPVAPPAPPPPSAPPASPSPPPSPTPITAAASPRPAQLQRVGTQKRAQASRPIHIVKHVARARRSPERQTAAIRAAAPLAASSPSSTLLLLILTIAVACALILVTSALLPARALPHFVLTFVDSRRPDIVVAGIAAILSIGIGLMAVQVLK